MGKVTFYFDAVDEQGLVVTDDKRIAFAFDAGIPGSDGKTVRYGAGAPSNSLGVDGDFYINTSNNFIYGPKAGAWPAGISLVGPTGATGATGATGPAPSGTGFVKVSGGVLQTPSTTIALSEMANLPTFTIIGNNTGASATPVAMTVAQVNTLLGTATVAGGITQFPAFTSADLAAELTDETGSAGGGVAVFSNSPTIAAPVLTGITSFRFTGGTASQEGRHSHDGTHYNISTATGQIRLNTLTVPTVGLYASLGGYVASDGNFLLNSTGSIRWSSSGGAVGGGAVATAVTQNASGVVEINNGTAGTLRDLTLRNLTASGTVRYSGATVNDFITVGGAASLTITAASNALGAHYQLIGDTTASGGPAELRYGSGGFISWRSTARADSGSTVLTISRAADGVARIGTTTTNALGSLQLANLTASGTVTLGVFTVGTLPTAATNARARAFASDSSLAFNSTNLGSTVTAGGSNLVPVWCNGTNWVIG